MKVEAPAALLARAVAARATNGIPPGYDVIVARAAGDRFSVSVNGVETAEAVLPDLPTTGQVRLQLNRADAPVRAEFLSIQLRRLAPDGTPLGPDGEPLPAPTPPEPDDWVDLFDGRSLAGWEGDGDPWSIEDGALVADLPAGGDGDGGSARLYSEETWGDAEVRAVVRVEGPTDAGVSLRHRGRETPRQAEAHVGGEGDPWMPTGSIYAWSRTAEAVQVQPPEALLARAAAARATNGEPPGWDVITARVVGDRFTVAVNGVVTATAALPASPSARSASARRPRSGGAVPGRNSIPHRPPGANKHFRPA